MGDTKEKILMTALQLFARDGYETVSVRTIVEELGMTKGALYRHYKNKRDIFDSIVERMFQIDAQRANDYQMPAETYEVMPDSYQNTSLEDIQTYTIEQLNDHRLKAGGLFRAEAQTLRLKVALGAKAPSFPD